MITRTQPHKPDVPQIVTEQILEALEQGVVPWQKPWKTHLPMNMVSGRQYHGINLLILALSPHSSPFYLTFNQVSALGGQVKPGSKSIRIVYWRILEHMNSDTGELTEVPLMKYYCLFSLDQCLNIPEDKIPQLEEHPFSPIEACEKVFADMPNKPALIDAQEAYYNRKEDLVGIPPAKAFVSTEEYYSTLFHELCHSTGHPKRLNRDNKYDQSGYDDAYSNEELIAEIGSSILCAYVGISPRTIKNQEAYIAHWYKRLKSDKRLIIGASAMAQKAADYIMHLPGQINYNACTWLGDYHI